MPSVCLYFHVHQPFRLRRYTVFDTDPHYFDDNANAEIVRKVANKCYLPANKMIQDLIDRYPGRFKASYSITGTIVEQFRRWAPEVLESFQRLAASGNVELICETYFHSLAFIYSPSEFCAQVEQQARMLSDVFGQRPRAFRNTELIYNNDVARRVFDIGYDTILCEGADHLLGYRSPGFVYKPPGRPEVRLLLKHYRLSDDIAFRFGNRAWKEWPLTADKFAHWVDQMGLDGQTVNLFMDYETFGEHQWAETGIFDFFYHLPEFVLKYPHNDFRTPSQVAESYWSVGEYDVPNLTSWADTERDLTAWLGNSMQTHAVQEIYKLEAAVLKTGDERLLDDWRKLQTSDHFYYMCTKYFADGDVHKYFSPYDSPYDSYINYMNVLDNLRHRLGH